MVFRFDAEKATRLDSSAFLEALIGDYSAGCRGVRLLGTRGDRYHKDCWVIFLFPALYSTHGVEYCWTRPSAGRVASPDRSHVAHLFLPAHRGFYPRGGGVHKDSHHASTSPSSRCVCVADAICLLLLLLPPPIPCVRRDNIILILPGYLQGVAV